MTASGRLNHITRGRLAAILSAALAAAGAIAHPVPFGPQIVITGTFIDARTVIAADIDGDGDLDPIGASLGGDKVSWFENSGSVPPTYTERVITTNARDARECFAIDLDFDGDIDVIAASRQDDKIAWHENLNGDGSAWTEHVVSTAVIGSWSAWAEDIDGDGDLDVLSAGRDDNRISWHENTDGLGLTWTRHIVSSTANRAQKAVAADVDADGDMDMLSASGANSTIAWYENTGGSPPVFVSRVISNTASNAKWVKTADIDGDGLLDVLSASEGNGQIRWYRNTGAVPPTFEPFTVSVNSGAKVVEPVDFDLDGDTDLLSCGIGLDQIMYHENKGGSPLTWSTYVISTAADNPLTVYPADLDNDGDPDLLSASFMDNKIAWYENRSIHRSHRFATLQTVVNNGVVNGPWAIRIADLNLDGAPDLVSAFPYSDAIRWHQNTSDDLMPWITRDVSASAPSARSVALGDINADGHPDIVAATEGDNAVSVFYNSGAAIPTFTRSVVYPFLSGARAAEIADLDGDGDLDIASCARAGDQISWHENLGGSPAAWATHVITTSADGAETIAIADIDRDGRPDLVTGWENADTVAWHRNLGGAPLEWDTQIIADNINGPLAVAVADVDLDGDPDVVSVAANGDTVQWHENSGGPAPNWTIRLVDTAVTGAQCVAAADLDADGDLDLIVGAATLDRVYVYENLRGSPTMFQRSDVGELPFPDFPRSIAVGDINRDGRADLAIASRSDGRVLVAPNTGGQFGLPTTATAPEFVGNGSSVDLMRFDLVHRGRPGDSSVELASLRLRFERAAENPHKPPTLYTSAELNPVIDRLRIYRDDGSGAFDPADFLLATVETFDLVDGVQTVPFPDGSPIARAQFGVTPTFFVVAEFAADASSQFPRQMLVTHETAASAGEDAVADITLRPDELADVSTQSVTAGAFCPGDANGDNLVNFADLNIVLGNFNRSGAGVAGDLNGDGVVNFADLNLVLSSYNGTCQ